MFGAEFSPFPPAAARRLLLREVLQPQRTRGRDGPVALKSARQAQAETRKERKGPSCCVGEIKGWTGRAEAIGRGWSLVPEDAVDSLRRGPAGEIGRIAQFRVWPRAAHASSQSQRAGRSCRRPTKWGRRAQACCVALPHVCTATHESGPEPAAICRTGFANVFPPSESSGETETTDVFAACFGRFGDEDLCLCSSFTMNMHIMQGAINTCGMRHLLLL